MAKNPAHGLAVLFLLAAATLPAQSNEMIDSILAEDTATVGSAAYLALASARLIPDAASREDAVRRAREAGWLPAEAEATRPATFGEAAFLLMQANAVRGGLMYRLIPGPRYAAREFVYQGWSPERRAPREPVSGSLLVRVTANFLEHTEVSP